MQKLLAISQKKARLIKLYNITGSALKTLKPKQRQAMFKRYITQKWTAKSQQDIRSIRRLSTSGLNAFSKVLEQKGYTQSWFEENYLDFGFISSIYEAYIYEEKGGDYSEYTTPNPNTQKKSQGKSPKMTA